MNSVMLRGIKAFPVSFHLEPRTNTLEGRGIGQVAEQA